MALAGDLGADITLPDGINPTGFLFGEDQARYLVVTDNPQQVVDAARDTGVPATALGVCRGGEIVIADLGSIALSELREAHESWMPAFMTGT